MACIMQGVLDQWREPRLGYIFWYRPFGGMDYAMAGILAHIGLGMIVAWGDENKSGVRYGIEPTIGLRGYKVSADGVPMMVTI